MNQNRAILTLSLICLCLTPTLSLAGECDLICTDIERSIAKDIQFKCNTATNRITQSPEECAKTVTATFPIKPYCDSYRAAFKGSEGEIVSASVYTTAAATCALACTWDFMCTSADAASVAADSNAVSVCAAASAAAAACGPFAAGCVAMAQLPCIAATQAAEAASAYALETCATSRVIDSTCLGMGITAGASDIATALMNDRYMSALINTGATAVGAYTSVTGQAHPCVATGTLGTMAGWKWSTLPDNQKTQNNACNTIIKMTSGPAIGLDNKENPKNEPSSRPTPLIANGNSTTTHTSPVGGHSGGSTYSTTPNGFAAFVKSPQFFTQVSPPLNKSKTSKNQPQQLSAIDTLSKYKVDPKKLIGNLDSMSPLKSIQSVIPKIPAPLSGALNKIDKDMKTGTLTPSMMGLTSHSELNVPSTTTGPLSSGGSAAGFTGGNIGGFGSKGFEPLPAPSAAFEPLQGTNAKSEFLGKDGDIWHEGTNLSLFEIVSTRTLKSMDRVEKLEWSTRVNRSFHGLAPQK